MKKAIVVGASSGIGKALANLLATDGYSVGITGRRTELLNEIKTTNPKQYIVKVFDVNEIAHISNHLSSLVNELGGLDLLIISAGTGDINKGLDVAIELKTAQTNVLGFTAIANWAFNYFEQQQKGHLVAISSIAGLRGSRQAPAYNATKAFQINYLEGLTQKAAKLKKEIYVTDIRPGLVNTAMAKGEGLFWVMPLQKATAQIYTAIKKKKKVVYITKRWRIIASILKAIPRFIYYKM